MKASKQFAIALLVLALFAPVSVWAQEPTEEAVQVEVEQGQSETIPAPTGDAEITVTAEEDTTSIYQMIINFAFTIFGVLVGGGGVFAVLSRANKSKELKDSTEKLLADGVPQQYLEGAHQVTMAMLGQVETAVKAVTDTLTFIRDVTDGQPNTGAQG